MLELIMPQGHVLTNRQFVILFIEPLYQVYTARTLQRDRTLSRKKTIAGHNESVLEDITKGTLRNMRMLWCEIPEVHTNL